MPRKLKPKLLPPAKVIPLDDAARRRIEVRKEIENLANLATHINSLANMWGDRATKLLEERHECARKKGGKR